MAHVARLVVIQPPIDGVFPFGTRLYGVHHERVLAALDRRVERPTQALDPHVAVVARRVYVERVAVPDEFGELLEERETVQRERALKIELVPPFSVEHARFLCTESVKHVAAHEREEFSFSQVQRDEAIRVQKAHARSAYFHGYGFASERGHRFLADGRGEHFPLLPGERQRRTRIACAFFGLGNLHELVLCEGRGGAGLLERPGNGLLGRWSLDGNDVSRQSLRAARSGDRFFPRVCFEQYELLHADTPIVGVL